MNHDRREGSWRGLGTRTAAFTLELPPGKKHGHTPRLSRLQSEPKAGHLWVESSEKPGLSIGVLSVGRGDRQGVGLPAPAMVLAGSASATSAAGILAEVGEEQCSVLVTR